jgi:hypothetical protein
MYTQVRKVSDGIKDPPLQQQQCMQVSAKLMDVAWTQIDPNDLCCSD